MNYLIIKEHSKTEGPIRNTINIIIIICLSITGFIVGTIFALSVLLSIAGFVDISVHHKQIFERQNWLSYSNRSSMLSDLVQHNIQYGMTKKEVHSIMGKPDDNTTNKGENIENYNIGPCGILFLDNCDLSLEYTKSNHLIFASRTERD